MNILSKVGKQRNYTWLSVSANCRRTFTTTSRLFETTQTQPNTASDEEIKKFNQLASSWWDPNGSFKALHSMNKLRVQFIREGLFNNGQILGNADGPKPLEGLRLLDIGSGGGILSEVRFPSKLKVDECVQFYVFYTTSGIRKNDSWKTRTPLVDFDFIDLQPLARLGAQVTGIDAEQESVNAASLHAKSQPDISNKVNYECMTVEQLASSRPDFKVDAVVMSEVAEHVTNLHVFFQYACQMLKIGGSIFVTTINRTNASFLGAILAAEYVLRIVPTGTHEWKKFVTPDQTGNLLNENGVRTRLIHGMFYNPWTNGWSWTSDTSINYAVHGIKHDDLPPFVYDAVTNPPPTSSSFGPKS